MSEICDKQAQAEDLIHKVAEMENLARESPQLARGFPHLDAYSLERIMSVMQHSIDQWQLELDWARNLREKEESVVEDDGTGGGVRQQEEDYMDTKTIAPSAAASPAETITMSRRLSHFDSHTQAIVQEAR